MTREQVIRGPGSVYCLKEPLSEAVRYVGVTSKPLRVRLSDHFYAARKGIYNARLGEWIRGLAAIGLKPRIVLLEECLGRVEGEIKWVREMRDRGEEIFNITGGGLGHSGASRSPQTKSRLREANLGKTHTDESRELMSKRRKGIPKSELHKKAIGAAHKGKRHSKSHIENQSASLRASGGARKPKSPEHRNLLRAHLAKLVAAKKEAVADRRRKAKEVVAAKEVMSVIAEAPDGR